MAFLFFVVVAGGGGGYEGVRRFEWGDTMGGGSAGCGRVLVTIRECVD